MIDRELTGLFATLDHEPEPPLPPGQLEQIVTLGRRKARNHRFAKAAALIVMTLTFGLAGYVLPGQLPTGLGGGDDGVVLPDRIAGYGMLTADAGRHPAGKALLLFDSGSNEIFRTVQSLALSEDGRNYRHVSAVGNSDRQALLSPDGGSVLIVERLGETSAFVQIDLKTGKRQEIPLPASAGVMLHAWSPDGRYVAFAQTPWQGTELSNALELALYSKGVLNVLDLTTWKITELPEMTPAAAASFAPGSEQLAVQRGAETWVVNVDGSRARQITMPAEGLGHHAFSGVVAGWATTGPHRLAC